MVNGIINVYKEKGFTSFDVVAKLRGIVKQKKIGHTGTLDPDATGVLPVCLGHGTKLCDMLTDKDKTYKAVMLLGTVTDTQDTSGKVLSTSEVFSTRDEIEEAVLSFVGEYNQLPPMYSAIKVGGRKLYELAREGKEIPRETRNVSIRGIEIEEIDIENKEVTMTVHCSKGTYIRTLCHDIGEMLSCGGCMKELMRTKVGNFDISTSLTIDQIRTLVEEGTFHETVIPVDQMFDYDKIIMVESCDKYLYNGNSFLKEHCMPYGEQVGTPSVLVYDSKGQFLAVYEYREEEKRYKSIKMFSS